MLAKQISRISLSIVSEMTENPTAKYVKFWFRATLLIILGRSSVIGPVARILAALEIMQLFRVRVISVKKKGSAEILTIPQRYHPFAQQEPFLMVTRLHIPMAQ